MAKKITQNEFIRKAKEIHPEYDYSKVVYTNIKSKVILICSLHGEFPIIPSDILVGKGCKKCGFIKSSDKQRLSTEEFIKKAKQNFPNYDYSKVDYKGATNKIIVVCLKHGEFTILPSKLTTKNGYGCQKCGYERSANKQKKDKNIFFNELMKVHPEFDYSETFYINSKETISVICKKHGKFSTTPDSFLHSKYGCPKCAIDANADKCRLTRDDFIKKAQKVHPDLDFSLVNYTRSADKITLICKIHGTFSRKANDILLGGGCPKCGIIKRSRKIAKSQEDFIKEVSLKFPDLDFTEVNYITSDDKVTVICKKHGRFYITPTQLLGKSKHGCPDCANEAIGLALKFTNEQFIEKAKTILPEYDYSNVEYVNQDCKVSIICPKHGEFRIRAGNVITGHGCPICKAPKGELYIRNWLIKNHIQYEFQYKFKELGNLSYDFFIPTKNMLIEFNGEQHYGIVPFFHRNKRHDKYSLMGLRVQFKNDMDKKAFAENNGFDLLVIPYWDYDKIDQILSNKLL